MGGNKKINICSSNNIQIIHVFIYIFSLAAISQLLTCTNQCFCFNCSRITAYVQLSHKFTGQLLTHLLESIVGPQNITISLRTYVSNRSVTLIGNVFLYGSQPVVQNVFWTKNGEELDTKGSGGRYSEVTVDNPSLTICEVNECDAGSYQLTATNDAWSATSDILILGIKLILEI